MTTPNTSLEQARHLIRLSDAIYPALSAENEGEMRARRSLRLGIQAVAMAKGEGAAYQTAAGTAWMGILHQELTSGGIHLSTYAAWPRYEQVMRGIVSAPTPTAYHRPLDVLAKRYADVQRATIAADGSYETNATHVTHLSALALPYAAEHHPDLHLPSIALYALLHDLPEAYAGDTPSLGMSAEARKIKEMKEFAALHRIKDEFSNEFPEFVRSCEAYELLADDEAKFVKTFDKLDPSFTHISNGCLAIRRDMKIDSPETLRTLNQQTEDSMTYSRKFPQLISIRRELAEKAIALAPWGKKIPA